MPDSALDLAERERLAADVLAAVERLLRNGQRGRVEVNVHPDSRSPVSRPRVFLYERAT